MGESEGVRRVERSIAETGRAYDRLAPWYDTIASIGERRLLDEAVGLLELRTGEKVLEIGCATGRGLVQLSAAVGMTGFASGVDLSGAMLRVAGRKLLRAGAGRCVHLCQADAKAIACKEDTFDALLMGFTLELFDTPDIPRVLAECRRVLRRGGRLCIASLSRRGGPGFAVRLYEWFHDRMPAVADCRPILVEDSIRNAGFIIAGVVQRSLAGLPVEIVLSTKPSSSGSEHTEQRRSQG